MSVSLHALQPIRKLLALGIVLAAAGAGCSEQPKPKTAPAPMDKVMEENQKAAVAIVHAAKEVAKKANDHAQEVADAAKDAVEAITAVARDAFDGTNDAMKGD